MPTRSSPSEAALGLLELRERELEDRAARSLHQPVAGIQRCVAGWGRALGPPWTQDEKRAALVAWMALATGGGPPRAAGGA